jgi:hypothetical protein
VLRRRELDPDRRVEERLRDPEELLERRRVRRRPFER